MNWITLNRDAQLDDIIQKSFEKAQLIYKHSISCPTSSMAKHRLEKSVDPGNIDFHYLDILNNRLVSNKIADQFEVRHESPQVLLIKNGKCVYHSSHHRINMADIATQVM